MGCRRAVDASWSFCPFCGADNRDPALHQGPVGAHSHDFRFAAHCVLCGATGGAQPVLQGKKAAMWNLPPWWVRLIIGLLIALWGLWGLHLGIEAIMTKKTNIGLSSGLRGGWDGINHGSDAVKAGIGMTMASLVPLSLAFVVIFLPSIFRRLGIWRDSQNSDSNGPDGP